MGQIYTICVVNYHLSNFAFTTITTTYKHLLTTTQITPLNGSKAVSSDLLVRKLLKEAEMLRKEKKKSNFGGVHK